MIALLKELNFLPIFEMFEKYIDLFFNTIKNAISQFPQERE